MVSRLLDNINNIQADQVDIYSNTTLYLNVNTRQVTLGKVNIKWK